MFDPVPAQQFIAAIGKNGTTRARAFFHASDPRKIRPDGTKDPGRKGALFLADGVTINTAELQRWQDEGRGIYFTVNEGGDTKASITSCIAYFAEFDTGTLDEQFQRVMAAGMPEPTVVVYSGGDSLHFYWFLDQPIACAPTRDCPIKLKWQEEQRWLAVHLGSDKSINDPSRVMRLPGAWYAEGAGQFKDQARVHFWSGKRYSRERLLAVIPEPTPAPATSQPSLPTAATPTASPQGNLRRALEQLSRCPPRLPGTNTREAYLTALWGMAAEIGPQEAGRHFAARMPAWHAEEDLIEKAKEQERSSGWDGFFGAMKQLGITDPPRVEGPAPDLWTPTGGSGGAGGPGAPATAASPTQAAVDRSSAETARTLLSEAIANGVRGAAMAARVAEVSSITDLSPYAVKDILKALQEDVSESDSFTAGGAAIRKGLAFGRDAKAIKLDMIFHPRVAHAIGVICRYMPYDAPSMAAVYLAGIAACLPLGSKVMAIPASDYSVLLNLYIAIVGKSGAKKTPLLRLLIKNPLRPIIDELFKKYEAAFNEHELNMALRSKGDTSPKPQPPKETHLIVNDVTPEALAEQLAIQEGSGRALLMLRDELMGMLNAHNQYKAKGRGDGAEQMLELFDGDGSTSLRVRGHRRFSRSQLSIFGNIQPKLWSGLIAGGDPSGKFARFFVAPLPGTAVKLPSSSTPEELAELEEANQLLKGIARYLFDSEATTVQLDDYARKVFVEFEYRAQQRANEEDDTSAASAIYGKSAAKVLRVAGLLHHIDRAAGADVDVIDQPTLDRAIRLVQHLDAWAIHFNDTAQAADLIVGDLKTIHNKAVALQDSGVPATWRNVQNRLTTKQRQDIDRPRFLQLAQELATAEVGTFDGTTYVPIERLLN